MPEFQVEHGDITEEKHGNYLSFEVYCQNCGEGICHLAETVRTRRRGMPSVRVKPCETCMDNAKFDARKEGYEEGRADHDGCIR